MKLWRERQMSNYTTELYTKVSEILRNAEDKKSKVEARIKEIECVVAGLKHEHEAQILMDDSRAEQTAEQIRMLEVEYVDVSKKLEIYSNDKNDVLMRSPEFKKLVDELTENNLEKIKDLQERYNKNNVQLVQLRNEFYKLVIEQGEIKRHSDCLAREMNIVKAKNDNRHYSGVVDNQNMIKKEGTIFIDNGLSESLYKNIMPYISQEYKTLFDNVVKAYQNKQIN
jgi:hypothetical protein